MKNGRGAYSANFRFYEIQQTLQNHKNRSDGLHRWTLIVLPSRKIGVASDLPNQGHGGLAVSANGYCR
jgi:hypothetical protein